ncbi:MAG: hypothetical protein ACXVYY_19620 [Oryzihumus sp.]
MIRTRLARCLLSLAVAATSALGLAAPAHALGVGDHESPSMVDVDTPLYLGYDSTLKAYHFSVNGRWRAVCGTGQFCWPARAGDIGSDDAVGIHFNGSMQVKKEQVRTWDYCGDLTSNRTRTSPSGGFFDYYAAVNDQVYESYRTWGGIAGSGSYGDCSSSFLPTSTAQGGGAWVKQWFDMTGQRFTYDVWVNPAPTSGSCYSRVYVKGEYTHTWSTQGLAFSLGYPWGVGVGVVDGSSDFSVYQDGDGYHDPDLVTGQLCRH